MWITAFELIGEPGLEVVRDALGLGLVDDADRAFEAPFVEARRVEQEAGLAQQVEEVFPASAQGPADALALGGAAPVRSGGDGARVGRGGREQRLVAVAGADELADVELSGLAELRRPGVADVQVVRLDGGLRRAAACGSHGSSPPKAVSYA